MGGMISMHILIHYPQRVVSCILGGTYASSKTCEHNPEFTKFGQLPPVVDGSAEAIERQQQSLGFFLTPEFIADPQNKAVLDILQANRTKYTRTVKGKLFIQVSYINYYQNFMVVIVCIYQ